MTRPVAVVTGGSRGIGAATVLGLVQRGHDVHFTYRARADLAAQVVQAGSAQGATLVAHHVDCADERALVAFAARLEETVGAVDVLVNNAGATDDALILSTTTERFERLLRVNVTAPFVLTRELLPGMLDRHRGAIINVSSSSAERPAAGQAGYAAAKAAVEALTRATHAEVGSKGIRVNCVAPGAVLTDMTRALHAQAPKGGASWGTPEDVAKVICFLASDDAAYVRGQVLLVDGGRGRMREVRR